MTIITKEHLFQWNVEQVLKRIETDWKREIIAAYEDKNSGIMTLEDWLNANPDVLGRYMCERVSGCVPSIRVAVRNGTCGLERKMCRVSLDWAWLRTKPVSEWKRRFVSLQGCVNNCWPVFWQRFPISN